MSSVSMRGLTVDGGFVFDPEGEAFEHINIACPRSVLAEGLDRIRKAIGRLLAVAAHSQGQAVAAYQLADVP